WITDGNYSTVRDLLWPRGQLVIWLNFSFITIFGRVFIRTMRRSLNGTTLWQGNRESWRRSFLSRESILWWVIRNIARHRRQLIELRASGKFAQLQWVEMTTPEELERFIGELR
ncbi:MAG: toxin, partial [Ramlibacter sp.]|nr:toxin [Ramlibacter sp.]